MTVSKEPWHLSKSVPITLIFAIFLQTLGIVWWASGIDNRVQNIEQSILTMSADLASENLRQWQRINEAESALERTISQNNVTAAILQRLEATVATLGEDVRETNKILRDLPSGN